MQEYLVALKYLLQQEINANPLFAEKCNVEDKDKLVKCWNYIGSQVQKLNVCGVASNQAKRWACDFYNDELWKTEPSKACVRGAVVAENEEEDKIINAKEVPEVEEKVVTRKIQYNGEEIGTRKEKVTKPAKVKKVVTKVEKKEVEQMTLFDFDD
jgi:hypothetical protein